MARLVIKDGITSGGALASGQTLRLGCFTMTARPAFKLTMTSRVIENSLQLEIHRADGSNGALFERALGLHRRSGSRYGL